MASSYKGRRKYIFVVCSYISTARFVESVHFFLVILLTAEPVRILKMEVPQVSNFEFFTAEPLNFHYCWTFEILDLLVCLLLNLWTFFTAEPLRFLTALSVYCWTFELCLLLNLWDSLPVCLLLNLWNFLYCWTFEISKGQQ